MMALDIPNVPGVLGSLLQGINTGGGLYSKLMQPILSREELAQKAKQHKDEMALRRAALARAGANADIQRQLLQQQLISAQHANDPMYAFNQYKTLQDMIRGKTSTSSAPSELAGQGMGVFSPEGLSNEQAMGGDNTGGSGGIDLELLKQNPILRGFFKHQFRYDPLAETPEEKNAAAFDLFKKKEEFKKGLTGDNVPLTTAMKTKLQGVVSGVDNSLPVIQELVNDFKNLPTGIETFNPSAYAAYNAKANSIIEPLINAFGLNVTDATKQMMHDQVFRKTNEPLSKYRDRLVDLAKEIIRRRDDSFKSLKAGAIDSKSQFTNEYFDSLKGETKELNGKKYRKIDGEWHEIE